MKFLRSAGFSILEVMVTAGLLGALSLGMASLMQNQNQVKKTGIAKTDANNFFSILYSMLRDQRTCDNNFKNKSINETVIVFFDKKNDAFFTVGEKDPKKYPFVVENFSLQKLDDSSAQIDIEINYNFQNILGGKKEKRSFRIPLVINGNTIVKCGQADLDITQAAATQAEMEFCQDMGLWNGSSCDYNQNICPSSTYSAWVNGAWKCIPVLTSNSQLLECPSSAPVTIAINSQGSIEKTCGAGGGPPIDGGWSDWVPATSCETFLNGCKNGNRSYLRSCTNPTPANGGQACTGQSSKIEADMDNCMPQTGDKGNDGSLCIL
jgi:type II secretory pathway pseudopilin PulG